MKYLFPIFIIIFLVCGCAHIVSKDVRGQVDESLSKSMLFEDPDAYKGSIVILGGNIVSSVNTQEGTVIEVVEKSLDYRGRPKDIDRSLGRFLVWHKEYLDTAIFTRGRNITVAGEVVGKKVRKLGDIDYSYVFLKNRELHLLQPGARMPIHFGIGVGVGID